MIISMLHSCEVKGCCLDSMNVHAGDYFPLLPIQLQLSSVVLYCKILVFKDGTSPLTLLNLLVIYYTYILKLFYVCILFTFFFLYSVFNNISLSLSSFSLSSSVGWHCFYGYLFVFQQIFFQVNAVENWLNGSRDWKPICCFMLRHCSDTHFPGRPWVWDGHIKR